MAIDPNIPRYDMPIEDVNHASKIMSECLNSALEQMSAKRLDKASAICAAVQTTMQLYASVIGNDEEAIRQIRQFLDEWECDLPTFTAVIH